MIHQSRPDRSTGSVDVAGSDPDPDQRELDLSGEPDEQAASRKGLSPPAAGPPPDDIRAVAVRLLLLIGICLTSIIVLTSALAWLNPGSLNEVISFFSTLVATLGTLLGGVVAFYFARR